MKNIQILDYNFIVLEILTFCLFADYLYPTFKARSITDSIYSWMGLKLIFFVYFHIPFLAYSPSAFIQTATFACEDCGNTDMLFYFVKNLILPKPLRACYFFDTKQQK